MIPDELVERIRESADIVQIIGEYVPLKKTGADYRGACPFHQGTHRNFSVSTSRNIYYCFVCNEGGDVFTFLRKRLGVEWPEAVRMVAARSGIEVPDNAARQEGPDPREPVWELNSTAAEYFSRVLWDEPIGAEARTYLERRAIGTDAARKFGLGFAPREIGLLRNHMAALGFDENRLLQGGLLVRRDESSEPRPRFSGRLMFPITDASGRCVGFGGRLLGPGEPKYLNSPDSPVFSKGRLLYGLHSARSSIRREERAILVEGYFDAVRLVLAGAEHTVAPLGTALTEDQATLLKKYTKEVVLLYDSDAAGLKATFRAGDLLLSHGLAVQVATLPAGEDPDSFVAANGRAGLDELLSKAVDVFEKKLRLLDQKGWFRDLTNRRRAIDRLLPTIRAASDPVTRDLYATRASEVSGVSKDTLLAEAGAMRRGVMRPVSPAAADSAPAHAPQRPEATGVRAGKQRSASQRVVGESAERAILAVVLNTPAWLESVAQRVGADDFWVPEHRSIYQLLVESGGEATVEELERDLPPDALDHFRRIREYGATLEDFPRTLHDSLRRVESRSVERALRKNQKQMGIATEQEQDALMQDGKLLKDKLVQLGGGSWRLGVRKTKQ